MFTKIPIANRSSVSHPCARRTGRRASTRYRSRRAPPVAKPAAGRPPPTHGQGLGEHSLRTVKIAAQPPHVADVVCGGHVPHGLGRIRLDLHHPDRRLPVSRRTPLGPLPDRSWPSSRRRRCSAKWSHPVPPPTIPAALAPTSASAPVIPRTPFGHCRVRLVPNGLRRHRSTQQSHRAPPPPIPVASAPIDALLGARNSS